MKTTNILLLSSLIFTCGSTFASSDYVAHRTHELVGGIEYQDAFYGVSTIVDQIKTPGGKVYVQPEEFKLKKFVVLDADDPYMGRSYDASFKGKVSCNFDGPGVKAFTQAQVNHGIECSWKEKPGSDALVIPFKMFLLKADQASAGYEENDPLFKGYKVNALTIKGKLPLTDEDYADVSLKLDEANYRNGSSHSVFIRGKVQGEDSISKQKVLFEPKHNINGESYRIKLLGCTNGIRSAGSIDIFVGKTPKAECEFIVQKKIKGAGWVTSPVTQKVTLQK